MFLNGVLIFIDVLETKGIIPINLLITKFPLSHLHWKLFNGKVLEQKRLI